MRRRPMKFPPEVLALERQIELINRFPDQNPNPVMRMTGDGLLTYANPASAEILAALDVVVGDRLPASILEGLRWAVEAGDSATVDVVSNLRTYAVLPVAVPEFDVINLYGTDVTATRVLARFPDRNPNPVLRVSEDGLLLYANPASRQLTREFGSTIGAPLPDEVRRKMRGALDGTMTASFEVESEGHTYQLLPVRIPEFGFINLYGTDITARKAIDKFPGQNPNPVLRVAREGQLVYANAAAERIRRAFGVPVGDILPAAWLAPIRDRVERASDEVIEVDSEGRRFAVLVKDVPEFNFINLYGTDVTAERDNERLLLNILPAAIAARLRAGEKVIADRYDDVTLLFADIVDFTRLSSQLAASELVEVLNDVFSLFDGLVDRYRLEKIKTIGDAYMVVGGLESGDQTHTARVAEMALALADAVATLHEGRHASIQFRIGIHRGPAVAGVIGVKKFIYDVWGDTVNMASRMESHGVPGRIQVTESVVERLNREYDFEARGLVDIKGKGPVATWFLQRPISTRRSNHGHRGAGSASGSRSGARRP